MRFVSFAVGFIIGFPFGFFIAALMAASRRENELSEQEQWIAEHKREVDQC